MEMKKWIFIPLILLLAACSQEQDNSFFTPDKAILYFEKIKTACDADNGKIWGTNLYGPVMFIERTSRKITANQPDAEGLLKLKDGVYTGSYPRELVINNTAEYFGGTLFAMAPLPLEEDEFRIVTRAVHGLFHRFQKQSGYKLSGYNTANMDEKNARLWLKLEWKALSKALKSDSVERTFALRDALIFHCSNRELYHSYAIDETRFENNEGLATFTYLLLSTDSYEEYKTRLFETLDRIYSIPSFARSYGGIHGALYATLLYEKGFNFREIKADTTDLCELVKNEYSIQLPPICRDIAGSLAMNYDLETIQSEEKQRITEIMDRVTRQVATFIEKPIVFLELQSPYFDFEPEDVHPMDTLGTLYSRMRVADDWGKLTIDEGGCLVSNNYKSLRISAKGFRSEKSRITGDGWQLILNNDWEVIQVEQNYIVRRLMP